MSSVIPVNLAVEDALSEAVLRRLLREAGRGYEVGTVYGRSGFGYLRKTAPGWNAAARGVPFVLLTDLDLDECPQSLLAQWLPSGRHPNLLLRVAVREVEAWLLSDGEGIAEFLGCTGGKMPAEPDLLQDPKQTLLALAKSSRKQIRQRLLPRPGSTALQGPDYNGCLIEFVLRDWNIEAADKRSPSLRRTIERFGRFEPVWETGG